MKRVKPLKRGSLTGKLLRIFRKSADFREKRQPLKASSLTLDDHFIGFPNTGNYYNYRKEIESALLDAERKKAKALMEVHKHRFIC